jgi:hypothetical protein
MVFGGFSIGLSMGAGVNGFFMPFSVGLVAFLKDFGVVCMEDFVGGGGVCCFAAGSEIRKRISIEI